MNNYNRKVIIPLLHIIAWSVVFAIPFIIFINEGKDDTEHIFFRSFMHFIPLFILFYFNYLWSIDYFLFQRKSYLFFILLNILVILLISNIKYELVFGNHSFIKAPRRPPTQSFLYFDFMSNLLPVIFAISIKYAQQTFRLQLEQQEAQSIKLEAELQHLKYQLQPHFFFNALNNIYSMISFSPEKAQKSVHNLSKLMRHFLQNSNANYIWLEEEIDFLNQYIELMAVRMSEKTQVTTDFPTSPPPLRIAPLLFISLVENAFKHGVSATEHSKIHFSIKVHKKNITFVSENTLTAKTTKRMYCSGIGVENLQKRLQLLYPNKNSYQIKQCNGQYKATVSITTD